MNSTMTCAGVTVDRAACQRVTRTADLWQRQTSAICSFGSSEEPR